MSRTTLRWLAAILTAAIIIVGVMALDHLPSGVRTQIATDRTALVSATNQVRLAQEEIARLESADPALFRMVPLSQHWTDRFQRAGTDLQSANRDMDELSRLAKSGRHRDRERAEALLAHERKLRTGAVAEALAVRSAAAAWAARKQQFPLELRQLEANYRALKAFDLAPVTAVVRRAQTDWPAKHADLEQRLGALTAVPARGDSLWQATAEARRPGAAGIDYAALFLASDELKSAAAELPRRAEELKGLTGQLYDSWDKVLVDMEVRGTGTAREYNQKIRTVRTHENKTDSQERWTYVSKANYDAMRNNLGMAVEHKPAGKYDAEADRTAQPAGFAYMAPAGQANQYGRWERRDGRDFWVFYGQYALMRDLLFNHSYRPVERGDWEGYRDYRERGRTYYGPESRAEAPRYGSAGSQTQQRYAGSTYGQSGGFGSSKYATKSGGYGSSQYASPSLRDPGGDRGAKVFGRGRRDAEPHVSAPPPAARSYRPAPSRSMPSRPSGGGRSFGGRRR